MSEVSEKNSIRIIKGVFGLSAVATILLAFYGLPYIIDSMNMVHEPPTECGQIEQGEAFCEQRYFDDGHVRFSSSPSEKNNCCIMERRMISDNRRSYRILACDMQNLKSISCGSVESYGTNKWVVDKRILRVDESWEEHESKFIYNIGE